MEHSHINLLHIVYIAFVIRQLHRVVVTETVWPVKPKIFTIGPFSESVYWPLIDLLLSCLMPSRFLWTNTIHI